MDGRRRLRRDPAGRCPVPGVRPVVVPEHPPERLPAAPPGAGDQHDPAPDHGSRLEAGPRVLRGLGVVRPAPACPAGRLEPAAVHGQWRVRADPDAHRLRLDDRPADRAQPAPCPRRPRRSGSRVHRRYALRLARLQLRPVGLAAPKADGLPDDPRDDRLVRQGGQALRPRALLHRPLPDAVRGLPGSAARPGRRPILRRLRVEHDHDAGRVTDLPVRRVPGRRRPPDPG